MDETQHNAGCKHLTKIVSMCDITGNINVRCANCLYINWNTTLSNTPAIRNKLEELLFI
ncbi:MULTISPECIES: hypothetical protein [Spiroplasma]|uniref:Uncharacterized protein n=1 Tax=Spiroplasma poulsonii TaxID=2138 RepID=A0A2P6FG56_9MOLU|nr:MULTISPECIES: hypothetical protein [Spiroplasma]KAF0849946.1 hypothetical protein MSROBK_024040 [Spiroplasma poulsonii]PQM32440.1 hypothetical protein SMSRO_SF023610 [Spiroplasma poulsonii]PWF95106.1 hypothetical protein SMSE_05310 [Spiroplasma poulsonii]PWF97899.1 hypothetical protein SMH99_04490 [Spiroplasma poulsonii]UNF61317.1 hypothetical protein MNU24_05220 [Spiroplasma poulsonii]